MTHAPDCLYWYALWTLCPMAWCKCHKPKEDEREA